MMRQEDLNGVIQLYCEHTDDCARCKISELCEEIIGNFEDNPEHAVKAYDLIKDDIYVTHEYEDKDDVGGITQSFDPVERPEHYTSGKVECIDAMEDAFEKEAVKSFCLCNAFKYLWRQNKKGHLEDIKKANWYLTKYLELSKDEYE